MELKGIIVNIMPEKTGQGKNGVWKSQDIILQTDGKYAKKVAINLFGEAIEKYLPEINQRVVVQFDIESREYNGNWFTTVKAWKIEKDGGESNQPVQTVVAEEVNPTQQQAQQQNDPLNEESSLHF